MKLCQYVLYALSKHIFKNRSRSRVAINKMHHILGICLLLKSFKSFQEAYKIFTVYVETTMGVKNGGQVGRKTL